MSVAGDHPLGSVLVQVSRLVPSPCSVLMDPRIGGRINFSTGAKFSKCTQIIDRDQINEHVSLRGRNMLKR
jgi:hypothetical protein